MGEILIAITIQISFAAWLTGTSRLTWRYSRYDDPVVVYSWSIGVLAMLTHILSAYGFRHNWSQAAAVAHAGEKLLEYGFDSVSPALAIGINWIWSAVWIVDTLNRWNARSRRTSEQSRTSLLIRNIWLLFFWAFALMMWINAAVVFVPFPKSLIAACLLLIPAAGLVARMRNR